MGFWEQMNGGSTDYRSSRGKVSSCQPIETDDADIVSSAENSEEEFSLENFLLEWERKSKYLNDSDKEIFDELIKLAEDLGFVEVKKTKEIDEYFTDIDSEIIEAIFLNGLGDKFLSYVDKYLSLFDSKQQVQYSTKLLSLAKGDKKDYIYEELAPEIYNNMILDLREIENINGDLMNKVITCGMEYEVGSNCLRKLSGFVSANPLQLI